MIESEVMDTLVGDEHITVEQMMDVNIGTYGPGDYVLPTGRQCEAQLITNNKLRIFDGVMVYGGVRDVIATNNYHDVTIENGTQGMFRNDIVVRYFEKDEVEKTGKAIFKTIKGTPSNGEAVDPEIVDTVLRNGALNHSMKMYRVKLEGLNVVGVEPLFKKLKSAEEMKKELDELNSNSYDLTKGTLSLATRSYELKKYKDKTFQLRGNVTSSKIALTYSESSKIYFTPIKVTLPAELTIDTEKKYAFSGSVESSGIYFVSLNNITGKEMTIYLSAMNYTNVIPMIEIGFLLTGTWK